ncbi:DNA-binding transcriptional regulator, MarR family [Paenibacillus catalpae]|uniref:DNA-binding transcriptional regulator, MarR family n=1 Tax=Paenibacillus catalpae TaxID=1045775 RepID=A0A1I2F050_9BACL|nr:MarR family transcriptional regulator [Paenibacillus catalpae]SFE98742.1 DNA-binding transcriptional regulator, MarR family [Paenibacillus catalpae]
MNMDSDNKHNRENSPFSVLESQISLFVRRAEAVRLSNIMGKEMDRSSYLILQFLEKAGAAGIKTISTTFQLDISTVSRQIAALEAKGLISRLTDPNDARISLLQLTEEAPALLAEVRASREAFFKELLTDWDEEEVRIFGNLLLKFNQTAEQRIRSRS